MGGGGDINFTRANSEGDTIIDDDVCCVLRIVCIVVALLVYDNIMWANLRLRLLTRGTEQSMMHACMPATTEKGAPNFCRRGYLLTLPYWGDLLVRIMRLVPKVRTTHPE